jgi:hypothetical protein
VKILIMLFLTVTADGPGDQARRSPQLKFLISPLPQPHALKLGRKDLTAGEGRDGWFTSWSVATLVAASAAGVRRRNEWSHRAEIEPTRAASANGASRPPVGAPR